MKAWRKREDTHFREAKIKGHYHLLLPATPSYVFYHYPLPPTTSHVILLFFEFQKCKLPFYICIYFLWEDSGGSGKVANFLQERILIAFDFIWKISLFCYPSRSASERDIRNISFTFEYDLNLWIWIRLILYLKSWSYSTDFILKEDVDKCNKIIRMLINYK